LVKRFMSSSVGWVEPGVLVQRDGSGESAPLL
jgi:hypothetical protein